MHNKNFRLKFQKFGNFLSGMFLPNIGVFICWGFLTALFIPSGWFPNEKLASISQPMLNYLLPTLIGYTGGKLVYGSRGAAVGVVASFGIIIGSSIPMFLGAMIAGPIGGYIIKKFDELSKNSVKPGFEMLINNFSAGFISLGLAIFFFYIAGPAVEYLNNLLASGVNFLVQFHLLPLTSIIVEPAKVLFLNNAINYGIFSPLGMQHTSDFGKSIFFLIETNPGPGLGVLLAFMIFGKENERESSTGAAIIHFFGGIHEIYFPYIFMKPVLILALIAGGMTGIITYSLLGGGLVAPASPGSIFSLIAMSPKNDVLITLVGIVLSASMSFLVSSLLLKSFEVVKESEVEKEKPKIKKAVFYQGKFIHKIAVVCDAGFGTSAMGANILKRKLNALNMDIEVSNLSIMELDDSFDIVITHKNLTNSVSSKIDTTKILSLKNFVDDKFYTELVRSLALGHSELPSHEKVASKGLLLKENIKLGLMSLSKEEAIRKTGELLCRSGYVQKGYTDSMLKRESTFSTYVGNYIAIPHGKVMDGVLRTGIVILQFPDGIDFGDGNTAKILIGISAKHNEHLEIISSIVDIIEDRDLAEDISSTEDVEKIYELFSSI